jgi:hypothetical protein
MIDKKLVKWTLRNPGLPHLRNFQFGDRLVHN